MKREKCKTDVRGGLLRVPLLLVTSFAVAQSHAAAWQDVPLTTAQQARDGVAGGEGFQQVLSIAYSEASPKIVYMGSDTTRVWKSKDGGAHWFPAAEGIDSTGACSVTVHPEKPEIVFAAGCLGSEASRARQNRKRREGIYYSKNGGKQWRLVRKAEFHKQRSVGNLFAFDPRTVKGDRFTLYAGTFSEGLLVSRDGGLSWSSTGFNPGVIRDIEASPADAGTLLLATARGLFSYRDGRSQKIGKGLPGAPTNVAVSAAQPDRVVAAVEGRIYISNDRGRTFRSASLGLPPVGQSWVSDVFASPVDPKRLYATTSRSKIRGPFFSDDGGQRWQRLRSVKDLGLGAASGFWFSSPVAPSPAKPGTALTVSNGKAVVLGTSDGGANWHYSGSGYTGARVVDMAFESANRWLVGLTDHGLWQTTDGGKTFRQLRIPGVRPTSIGSVSVSGGQIVASIGGWNNKHLVISGDGGKSWRHVRQVKGRLGLVRHHPDNPKVIYAGNYKSVDGGSRWVRLPREVRAVFPGNGNLVYSFDRKTRSVLASFDQGMNWSTIARCSGYVGKVEEIAPDPARVGRLYLASNGGVFKVDNGVCRKVGVKRGYAPDAHGTLAARSVIVDPQNPDVIYAGRWAPGRGVSSGIYYSVDQGRTWAPFNTGMPGSFDVWSLEYNGHSRTLLSGTSYGLKKIALP